MTNSFSFFISENVVTFPLFLKDTFTEAIEFVAHKSVFQHWTNVMPFPLASGVSNDKSVVIRIGVHLSVICLSRFFFVFGFFVWTCAQRKKKRIDGRKF